MIEGFLFLKENHMKKFIQDNFTIIVLVIALLSLLKSCGDSREMNTIKKEIKEIKDSTYTKKELQKELKIMGLESEKRMIQSTDRKMLDVQRQSQIDEELKKLRNN
jgi:uncharacterized membrane protein (DUF106 family)